MILDQASLRELAAMKDEMGVLSVYATADPREKSTSWPAWRREVSNELSALRNHVAANGEKKRKTAVLAKLDSLETDLADVLDTGESGVGRALFAPVSSDEVRMLSLQMPLEDRAVLESRPYLRPLAAALSIGAPAGILAVSRDGVRLVDLRFGTATEVTKFSFEVDTSEWRTMRGPGGGKAGPAAHVSPQYDRFDRRVEQNLIQFLQSIRPDIEEHARQQGWQSLVITGEPRLVETVRGKLPANDQRDIILLDRVLESLSASEIAAQVRPELEAIRTRRCRELAERARGTALAGGQATVGASDTLGAFREERVAHLILASDQQLSGHRTSDGQYFPEGELPSQQTGDSVTHESDLGERMIERAFTSGADVTVLPTDVAHVLRADEGVAAYLRW